jgi:hypothetical protein
MDDNAVVYKPKERLVIRAEHRLDYECEVLDTGARYMIDKTVFRKKYEAVGTVKDNQ